MDLDAHQSAFMRSLALAVARGRSVVAWGRAKDVPLEKARGWTELPEFRLLVEKVRLEHSERMVGKLARCVGRAIERLVELSENTRHPGVSLGATNAIIEKWIHTSEHFIQAFQLKDLIARAKDIQARTKAKTSYKFREPYRGYRGTTGTPATGGTTGTAPA